MNIVESLKNLENRLFEERDEYHDLVGALLYKPDAKSMIMEMLENNDTEGIIKCLEENYIVEDADDYEQWTDEDNDIYNRWAFVKAKSVKDIDGFSTDYSMWREVEDGQATDHFVFILGDADVYDPENADWDWECDSIKEATEWFENYTGLEDEYDVDHAEEWMDKHPYGYYNNENDHGEDVDESLSWENDNRDGSNPLANKTLPLNDLGTMSRDELSRIERRRDELWHKEDKGALTAEEQEELTELTKKIEDHYTKKNKLMSECADKTLQESKEPTKDDIIDWLSEHHQAWEDVCDYFGSNDLSNIDYDEIIGWIFDHDTLSDDLMKHFGKQYFMEGCDEDAQELTESSLGEDKIYIHRGDVQFNDGSTKFYELKTIAPSDLKARNNFRYQVCINEFQDVNPFNLSRIYIPFENISEFTLEEVPEEDIELNDDGVQISMFDKVE